MDYQNAYDDMRDGGNGGNGDPSTPGPTGVPDPNNPGYDTNGYPLPGRTGPVTPTPGAATTQGPGTPAPAPAPGPKDPAPPPPPPDPSTGALAPFSEAAPGFPTMAPFQRRPDFAPTTFTAPTMEQALNDPGAQARWQRGQESLQNWAAARGTLNDTDTAKMLLDYGQNSEAQDYGNVYAREYGTWQGNEAARFGAWNANEGVDERAYGINRQTQSIDPWTAAYNEWVQKGNFYLNNQGTVANSALGFARL